MVRFVASLVAALLLAAAPALAKKPEQPGGSAGQGKGVGQARSQEAAPPGTAKRQGGGPRDGGPAHFASRDRDVFRDWWLDAYGRGHCPPGLAKKNNGCLPPGQAKKRYAIGAPLPAGVAIGPLPVSLAALLGAAPPGYRYGWIDGDVVKLAVGTLLVVDAIEGLAN